MQKYTNKKKLTHVHMWTLDSASTKRMNKIPCKYIGTPKLIEKLIQKIVDEPDQFLITTYLCCINHSKN